jgi:hypothetical protein
MIFRIYGFQIEMPIQYYVTIWKGSSFYEGTIEIFDEIGNIIRIDWNNLNKIIDKYKTPKDFFEKNIEEIKKIKSTYDYKLENYNWNSDINHDYYFHKLSYKIITKFPKREISDYIIGFGVFCKNSNRFITIQYRPPEKGKDIGDKAIEIISSFKCYCLE